MKLKRTKSSSTPFAVRQKRMLLSALRKLHTQFTLKMVSTPVVGRVRRLRAVWVAELEQELVAHYHVNAEPQLRRALNAYAKKKLNKKFYGKVTIRGKSTRNTNQARGNRKRRRAVQA